MRLDSTALLATLGHMEAVSHALLLSNNIMVALIKVSPSNIMLEISYYVLYWTDLPALFVFELFSFPFYFLAIR